tara:strand:+ start:375 stop:683 length:309 start_codon:yes stop_codon:yes gene_type:complete
MSSIFHSSNPHEVRVVGTNEALITNGEFGTLVGTELGAAPGPGVLCDVQWLDYPNEGDDEILFDNLRIVSEATYQIEVVERRLDLARLVDICEDVLGIGDAS